MDITIGVIILTWDEASKTIQLLERVSSFSGSNNNIHTILVDNGSESDVSATILKALEDTSGSFFYVKSETNVGFGAGMNLGVECLSGHARCDYFWFLNNDAMPDSSTLDNLLEYIAENPDKRIIGCTITDPVSGTIQCAGGCKYNSWFAMDKPIMKGIPASFLDESPPMEVTFDYIYGASFLVESGFFFKTGGFSRNYFLYFEELELATHCKRAELGWCRNAFVAHGSGLTTLSDDAMTMFSAYHAALSSFRFTNKHFAWKLPTVMTARLLGKICHAVVYKKPFLIKAVWLAIQDFICNRTRDQVNLVAG